MKNLILTGLACLLLMSCSTKPNLAPELAGPLPSAEVSKAAVPVIGAPLRATNVDEKGLKLAFNVFDTLLTAVDGLVAAKVIAPGSPRALALRSMLFRAKSALDAAGSAQRAGNAASYGAAIADAQAAIGSAKDAITGVSK